MKNNKDGNKYCDKYNKTGERIQIILSWFKTCSIFSFSDDNKPELLFNIQGLPVPVQENISNKTTLEFANYLLLTI